ncbi:MAG TPA: peptidoglycan-binding domain-containing protein [Solirubrobacterales bacterium]|nr:peptidoglycan-binding domain-containing protein [Solirubrobacterales bacterium]
MILALLAAPAVLPAGARAATGGAGAFESSGVGKGSPFARQGMWIWYVDQSQGGSVPAIVSTARSHGIGTVYIKAADGTTAWSQFTAALVEELHRGGLKVCAWQFVYGKSPVAEANLGAAAVAAGADCLAIDAESQYEGRYASASLYLRTLRAAIGERFPLSLAGFPYVDYHPAFPYSVFLGPGGAQVDQPQMYWKDIGTSVREVFAHTYLYNRLWGRPIFPVGQTYESPGRGPLRLFRRYAASYGTVPSWWDWQETGEREWGALGAGSGARKLPGFVPEVEYPLVKIGARGDLVVWAQERLLTAGAELEVNGVFDQTMRRAVRAFQEAHGLPGDGELGSETWAKLMAYAPAEVAWGASSAAPRFLSSVRPKFRTALAPDARRQPTEGR